MHSHDMKMIAICTGIQQASSTYPCPYCHWKSNYGKRNVGSKPAKPAVLRTFGSNRRNYENWKKHGGEKKKAMDFFNCTELPIIPYDDEDLVIEKFSPPELHIMLGIFNHMYDGMLSDASLSDFAIKWAENVGVSRRFCPSLSFIGNHCILLLKNVNRLLDLRPPRSIYKDCYDIQFKLHYTLHPTCKVIPYIRSIFGGTE